MRSSIELLQLLKEYLLKNNCSSMCDASVGLYIHGYLTINESNKLDELIKMMRPKSKPNNCSDDDWIRGFYFNKFEVEPRIEAINKLIEKKPNDQ